MVAFGWLSSIVPGLVTWDCQLLGNSGKGGRDAGGPGAYVCTWRHDGATPVKVSGLRSAVTLSLLSTRDAALPHLYVSLLWSYLKQLVRLLSSYNTAAKESFADNFVRQQNWLQVTTESHLNVLSWSPCNQNCSDTPGFTPHHHFQPFHLGAVYKFNESFIQTYFKSVCGFTFDSLTSWFGASGVRSYKYKQFLFDFWRRL